MELTINDLGMVCEAVYEARTKAYEIGLILRVPVDTLESIEDQYRVPGDKLREVLKTWLRTAPKPTWQDILDALRSRMVGQPKLASDIEAKRNLHSTVEAAHVSRETIPEVLPQKPTSAATQQRTLRQELQTKDKQLQELTEQLLAMKGPGPSPQKTATQEKAIRDMKWQKDSKAPEKMCRGSAAADANIAYFNGNDSTTVHSYNSDTREWCRLPDAPHTKSTLVVVHHILTMVGGWISDGATDSLLSLMEEGKEKKWLPDLPAMPTKRYDTAAVCSGRSLIVAGGWGNHSRLDIVEVLDTDTRQWSIVSSLPHAFSLNTLSICGERLYMLGGVDEIDYLLGPHSVLSCSIPELLQSGQTQPLAGKLQIALANKTTIWRYVADAPHKASSGASLCGQLVAVGGSGVFKNTGTITVYNERADSWEAMGDMPTARSDALVVVLNGKMMVVGGTIRGWVRDFMGSGNATDVVEILC